ncbi:hypothetical protein GCM10022276_24680 [Sphingomonas limnosediminicola]|uniref:ABC transporter n=1 Tax=Sphingomonas limnosediminicola TaxID=940133 RepID=A0ABP7LPM8_9SPHN
MTAARGRALLLIAALLIAAGAIAISRSRTPAPQERPTLLLLTSLPLVFGEGFSLDAGGSPALKALQSRYRVVPISVTEPAELRKGRLLLMAHPLAQPAEALIALDDWVRGGSHVLLLADPLLEWPSERPLGDPLRPPPMFMDTGLLKHWGLRLDAPDKRGPAHRRLGGEQVLTLSPGALSGTCNISGDRLVAHCRIGKGSATIVADADLLDAARLGDGASANLDGLLSELAQLDAK